MSYGITHTDILATEHRGYHAGEGFGGTHEVIDDTEFYNVEEGFEKFIESLITDDSFDYDSSWSFDKLELTSKNTETGEIIDLVFPNDFLSESDMKQIFLEKISEEKLKNLKDELIEEKNELVSLTERNEDEEKSNIAKILKRSEIKSEVNSKRIVIKSEIKKEQDKKDEIQLQMDTFAQGGDEEYYLNFYKDDNQEIDETLEILNQKLEDLSEYEVKLLKEITISSSDIKTEKVKEKYKRRMNERLENIRKVESFLKFINTPVIKKKRENNNIKSPS